MQNPAAVSDSGSKCPICGGINWELYTTDVEGYGQVDFARLCPRCKGELRAQDKTGVPSQYYDADLSKFQFDFYKKNMDKLEKLAKSFFDDFREWESNGKGLYLWSKTPGSGKTFLACCLGKSIMMRYDLQMRFTTAADYITMIGDSFKRDAGAPNKILVYRECKLLIFDDIGAQKSGEWQDQEIFNIVNGRLNSGCITIYTSNVPPEELNTHGRNIDRIISSSVVIQMPEESIRRKKADAEQEKFISKVLGV